MTNITEKDKSLASLALFSQLYEEQKNVISVIRDFVKQTLMNHGHLEVSDSDVSLWLKEDYGFEIPVAVVSTVMRQSSFLKKSSKVTYQVISSTFTEDATLYESNYNAINAEINDVIRKLRQHLRDRAFPNAENLSDTVLKKSLSTFLIEEGHQSKLMQYIEQFVILHSEVKPILQKIVQGSIIFMGLSFDYANLSYETVEKPLTIYLDTEILFFAAGYDGVTFKKLFDEFYSTISEINQINIKKNGQSLIRLKYFPEIKAEINEYFSAAESAIRCHRIIDSSRSAMAHIVTTGKTPSGIVAMKGMFWNVINSLNISEETYSAYYSEKNRDFNIESSTPLFSLSEENQEDYFDNLRLLNYVNILRGYNHNQPFKSIGYLFLTQTRNALKIANALKRQEVQETVSLAFSLGELTTKLWLGLNHGFNPSATLTSFDVIIKAQIALANRTVQLVEKKFHEIKNNPQKNNAEDIAIQIASIRTALPLKPEDITENNADLLQAEDMERIIQDKINDFQSKDNQLKSTKRQLARTSAEVRQYKTFFEDSVNQDYNTQIKDWRKRFYKYLLPRMGVNYIFSGLIIFIVIALVIVGVSELNEGNTTKGIWLLIADLLVGIAGIVEKITNVFGLKSAFGFLFIKKQRRRAYMSYAIKFSKKFSYPDKQTIRGQKLNQFTNTSNQ